MRLRLGSPVRCTDGPFGEVADVVIDPSSRRITHVVVQPHRRHRLARLVPITVVTEGESARAELLLRCTADEVQQLEPVEQLAYLRLGEFPVQDPDWDVGVETARRFRTTTRASSATR